MKRLTLTLAILLLFVVQGMAQTLTVEIKDPIIDDSKLKFEVTMTYTGTTSKPTFYMADAVCKFSLSNSSFTDPSITVTGLPHPTYKLDVHNTSFINNILTIELDKKGNLNQALPIADNTTESVMMVEISGLNATSSAGIDWAPTTTIYHFTSIDNNDRAIYTGAINFIGDPGFVVPVELISFTATMERDNIRLDWVTASELNNSHFEVEKSNDGRNWTTIGHVAGNGTSANTNRYSFVDVSANSNTYYKLKQVDFDGTYEYSNVIMVRGTSNIHANVFPTSTTVGSNINVDLDKNQQGQSEITVYNLQGKVVYSSTTEQTDYQINTASFAKGSYVVRVSQEGSSETFRIMLF